MKREDLRLVQITWRDHSADKGSGGWERLAELSTREEVIAHSVGWIVKEDDNHIVLASAVSDEYGASVQIVLKDLITKMVDLALIPTLKEKMHSRRTRQRARAVEQPGTVRE